MPGCMLMAAMAGMQEWHGDGGWKTEKANPRSKSKLGAGSPEAPSGWCSPRTRTVPAAEEWFTGHCFSDNHLINTFPNLFILDCGPADLVLLVSGMYKTQVVCLLLPSFVLDIGDKVMQR